MNPSLRGRARGMTLIELMTASAILGLMMAAVLGTLAENQRQYIAHGDVAAIQSTLRSAAGQIEHGIARAGYGIDPNYAVEPWELDAAGAEIVGRERDGIGPEGSDALVVQFRDPLFRRLLSSGSAGPGGFTLASAPLPGDELERGQRMLVLCGSAEDAAYVTVEDYDDASLAVTLAAGEAPFNQNARLAASCFGSNSALALRVERRHYFIAYLDEPGTLPARPALLVKRGVDVDGDGVPNEDPTPSLDNADDLQDAELLALDVDQLQVAYVMNRPQTCSGAPGASCADLAARYGLNTGPDKNNNFVYGDLPVGDHEAPSLAAPWSGSSAPTPPQPPLLSEFAACASLAPNSAGSCSYGAMRRFTGHPGNIRSVRVTLGARSSREDLVLRPSTIDLALDGPMENLSQAELTVPPSRRRRQRAGLTVTLKNMYLRRHFVPPVSDDPDARLNVDGG